MSDHQHHHYFSVIPGTTRPVPDLMTADEAARYLRLDYRDGKTPRSMAAAVRNLRRLVALGRIRATKIGNSYKFRRSELDAYIDRMTVSSDLPDDLDDDDETDEFEEQYGGEYGSASEGPPQPEANDPGRPPSDMIQ